MDSVFRQFLIFLTIALVYCLWIFVGYDLVGMVDIPL